MRMGSSIMVDGESQVLGPGEYGSILFEYTFTSTGNFNVGFGSLVRPVLVSDPKPETPGVIPGFPVESLVLSMILASLFLWMIKKE